MASLTRHCAQLAQKRPIVATLCCIFVVLLAVRLFAGTLLGSPRQDDSLLGPHQLQQNSQGGVVNGPRRDGAVPGSAIANHCAKDQIPLFHLPVASGAKCLDGSQPAFYYRRSPTAATATKWHVHFEGGGWCWDLPWCNNRADTSYGSSKSYAACLSAASLNQKDIFSTDPALNPHLHDWQTVHVKYCDGTSYTGNAVATYKGRKLFFKGQVNRDATISYLLQQLNMRNATEVVVSGCSAGGLAVYMGLDHIAAMIHAVNPHTIVRGLALSGFFADYSALEAVPSLSSSSGGIVAAVGGTSSFRGKADAASTVSSSSPVLYQTRDDGIVQNRLDYANALRHVYTMANMSAGIHRDCVRSRGVNCVFAKTLAPFLRTPIFSIQPQYDSWQLLHVLSKNFSAQQGQDFGQRLQHDMRQAFAPAAFSAAAAAAAASVAVSSRHGLYIESCAHHCFGCNPDVNEDAWNGAHIRAQLLPLTVATGDAATVAQRQPLLPTAATSSPTTSTGSTGSSGSSIRTPGPFTPAEAFDRWYRWSQVPRPSDDGAVPPLFFLQDAPFPCHDCCRCTAAPLAQSPPSLLSALAAKAIYVVPPELQG